MSRLLSIMVMCILVSCSNSVEKQIQEVDRLTLLQTELSGMELYQKTQIDKHMKEFSSYAAQRIVHITSVEKDIKASRGTITQCKKMIAAGVNPTAWVKWNDLRRRNQDVLSYEITAGHNTNSTERTLARLKRSEPLGISKCKRILPSLGDRVANQQQQINLDRENLKRRWDAFTDRAKKMEMDLIATQAVLDSIINVRNKAVFALSNMK